MSKAQLVMECEPAAARLNISVRDLKELVKDFQKGQKDAAKRLRRQRYHPEAAFR